jgi:hypothetical protein
MAKSKKRQKRKPPLNQRRRAKSPALDQEKQPARFSWIPPWGWILIFLVPLIISELMFYRAGRGVSMILFPIAWVGFWVAMMWRSGWAILKKDRNEKE